MSETRRAVETSDSNKDDKHRGSSGYASGRQAVPQAKKADNATLGVAASSGEVCVTAIVPYLKTYSIQGSKEHKRFFIKGFGGPP